jgi:hypothetical protein
VCEGNSKTGLWPVFALYKKVIILLYQAPVATVLSQLEYGSISDFHKTHRVLWLVPLAQVKNCVNAIFNWN